MVRQSKTSVEAARLAVEVALAEASGGTLLQEIRAAEAELESASESWRQVHDRLTQSTVVAPMTGTVLNLGLKVGQPSQQGQLLLVVGNLAQVTVRIRVDEIDVTKIATGQPLTIQTSAYGAERFSGEITQVAVQSTVQAAGGGTFYEVQGTVLNSDRRLLAGMNVEASLETDSRTNVLVVGLESVREEEGRTSVLVVRWSGAR